MMYNNLLSICIPTYNRSEKLKKCLTEIIPKVKEYNICFFISDNASIDDTKIVVEELQNIYPHIVYSRNSHNIGADRNIETVLKLSNTKYRWLMGDDDYIKSEDILNLIGDIYNNYDLIVINYLNKKVSYEEKIYTDMNQLLYEKGAHITFISALIFSDNMVINGNFEKFYDTHFVQVGVVFDYLAKDNSKVKFLPDIWVDALPNRQNSFYDKVFEYFTIDLYNVMELLPDYYLDKSKNGAIRKIVTDYFGYTYYPLASRINKEIDIVKFFKLNKKIIIAFPPIGVIIVFLLSITPIFVLKSLKKLGRLLKIL